MSSSDFVVFTGNANPRLAQEIVGHLGTQLGAATVGRFSDGEVTVELQQNIRNRDVFVVQSTCAPTNENMMELLIMVDALRRASAERIYAVAASLPGIKATGIDMHIGSQITDLQPFDDAFSLLGELIAHLRGQGHRIDHVDLGGGLGIPYRTDNTPPPDPAAYAAIVRRHVEPLGCRIIFEPGRLIAGNAGILVGEVIYIKQGDAKTFVIGNVAMNDLVRPTLYDAYHDIIPVKEPMKDHEWMTADLVGPVCETGDYMALERPLPVMRQGDLFAIMSAGAYGAVQAGSYNTRPLIAEVMVKGDQFHIVRPRQTVEALIAMDSVPDWFGA